MTLSEAFAARADLAAPEQSESLTPVGEVQHLHELNDDWVKLLPIGTKLYSERDVNDFINAQVAAQTMEASCLNNVILSLEAELATIKAAPQPTTPEPVNQMLLAALNACADALCNSQNFILSVSSDGFGAVCAEANGIAIDMANEILNAAEQAPQPTELTPKDIEALYMEHCPDDSLEAAIAFARAVLAAQKGKVK